MTAALQSEKQGAYITRSQSAELRKRIDADPWLFVKWIGGHGADDLTRFHRPLTYLLAGDAIRLAASLNIDESEVVQQIKADLSRRGIDWNTRQGIGRLAALLRRVNDRISRSMGKTTILLDVLLWAASRDPNISIGIASKSDDAAWDFCEAIGNRMRSPAYKMYYGDRFFPVNPEAYITKKWIRMFGRTMSEQETIEARGATSQWYSKHYHIIACDDLSSTEAKQGVATIEDAVRFIASMHGISISDRWGGTRFIFNGTIQGAKDDHARLASNPEYLSTVIPIWKRKDNGPWTMQNMLDDGIPVLPELYDAEAIRKKRSDTLANDTLGAISWLQNFLMCAHNAGSMQFTAELLRRQKFLWIDTKEKREDGSQVRLIRRYLYGEKWIPKRDEKFKTEVCRCNQGCGLKDHAFVQFDPMQLPRMLGVDQAISGRGDYWGVGASSIDHQGRLYQLKGEYDRGYWKMVPAVEKVFRRWGGSSNPPRKVGMESNTWQSVSTDWMKRTSEIASLAHRIEKLPPTITAKVMRILRDIHANLEMGVLWIDPEDTTFEQCALEYNAADPDNQWDDPLDCVAMSIQMHKHRPSAETDSDRKRKAFEDEITQQRDYDRATGVDLSDDFMESMWTN